MQMFQYDFMRHAFMVGIPLAIIIPCIGLVAVLRRLSMIGDALSHTSLAGVAAGLIMGINPIVGAVVACSIAALGIEGIRRRFPRHGELAIAIILSAGVSLSGILSGYVKSSANFNSFLFGSILAITSFELYLVIGLSAVVLLVFLLFYKELQFVSFDERGARLAGVRVGVVNTVFTILTAITVSIAARTVGALMVSSMMVIPAACSMQLAKSYRSALVLSAGCGVLFTIIGLTISFYAGPRPSATVVLVGVVVLLLLFIIKPLRRG